MKKELTDSEIRDKIVQSFLIENHLKNDMEQILKGFYDYANKKSAELNFINQEIKREELKKFINENSDKLAKEFINGLKEQEIRYYDSLKWYQKIFFKIKKIKNKLL